MHDSGSCQRILAFPGRPKLASFCLCDMWGTDSDCDCKEDDDSDTDTSSAEFAPERNDFVYDMMNKTANAHDNNFIVLNSPPECIVLTKRRNSEGLYGNLKTSLEHLKRSFWG